MVPWPHPTQHPKRHLNRFSFFAQLTAVGPYTLQCAVLFSGVRENPDVIPLKIAHSPI